MTIIRRTFVIEKHDEHSGVHEASETSEDRVFFITIKKYKVEDNSASL